MARIEKTVFISYRRSDFYAALAVFKDLTQHGYDAFIDHDGIASGDFEEAIVDNIRARAHFVILLNATALERCGDPSDWLRREIETALDAGRNVVPLLLDGFTMTHPVVAQRLVGALAPLRKVQALDVPGQYFDAAMHRLRARFLSVPVTAVLQAASPHALEVAAQQLDAALQAVAVRPTLAALPESPGPAEGGIRGGFPAFRLAGDHPLAALQTSFYSLMPTTADQGEPPGSADMCKAIGDDFFHGRNGRARNHEEALAWWRSAAEQGNVAAQHNVGWMNDEGLGGLQRDSAVAVRWYRRAADQEHAMAQYRLGRIYLAGSGGVEADDAIALNWFRRAAAQQHAGAQNEIGVLHGEGRGGLSADDAEAVRWFRLAADQGDASGQSNLGAMLAAGRGVPQRDDRTALKWLRSAVEQGCATAYYRLGVLHAEGRGGLEKDDVAALRHYQEGARLGDAAAQLALGDLYERGAGGLLKNNNEALAWYRKAAVQGHARAKARLAHMLQGGRRV